MCAGSGTVKTIAAHSLPAEEGSSLLGMRIYIGGRGGRVLVSSYVYDVCMFLTTAGPGAKPRRRQRTHTIFKTFSSSFSLFRDGVFGRDNARFVICIASPRNLVQPENRKKHNTRVHSDALRREDISQVLVSEVGFWFSISYQRPTNSARREMLLKCFLMHLGSCRHTPRTGGGSSHTQGPSWMTFPVPPHRNSIAGCRGNANCRY